MQSGRQTGECETFHVARSRFIDAYGEVEAAICERLLSCDVDPGNRQIGQKIEALKEIKASHRYSKAERTRIHNVLRRLQPFNDIRCDVVHAPLKLVELDGKRKACFINPRNLGQSTDVARHICLDDFERLTTKLVEIAIELGPQPTASG